MIQFEQGSFTQAHKQSRHAFIEMDHYRIGELMIIQQVNILDGFQIVPMPNSYVVENRIEKFNNRKELVVIFHYSIKND